MSLLLGVNLDHVATVRQARYAGMAASPNSEPCPVSAGHEALAGGADSLTIHVRGDRRHMQDADAFRIRAEVPLPLNLEMGVTEEMLELALALKPDFACLVPETRQEVTTEGGLDVIGGGRKLTDFIGKLRAAGIRVSLFIDPEVSQVEAAAASGAEMIELHTGCFANAEGDGTDAEIARLAAAAALGKSAGLQINAGHGINYTNVKRLWAVPHLTEFNIGHSIVARAVFIGFRNAVAEMKTQLGCYPG